MKRLVIGMTAHVDSGKTTLSEAMLYTAGELRKLGRVDHGDAFLDTDPIERSRGITIFSKQAVMRFGGNEYTLLDTPGHVDFSAETERALRVLDYAVLVISGTDGVQSHTETIWRLLRRYNIPTFIFVNKMDISFLGKDSLAAELKRKLSPGCVEFSMERSKEELCEELAECSEDLMNSFLETGSVPQELISAAIFRREVFPVVYGSALKLKGVETLLRTIDKFAFQPEQSGEFGALIYKITSDDQGARLT
ncbi:MAG: GTP-binding protein, partial [Eggerthellaceae bacterium]